MDRCADEWGYCPDEMAGAMGFHIAMGLKPIAMWKEARIVLYAEIDALYCRRSGLNNPAGLLTIAMGFKPIAMVRRKSIRSFEKTRLFIILNKF